MCLELCAVWCAVVLRSVIALEAHLSHARTHCRFLLQVDKSNNTVRNSAAIITFTVAEGDATIAGTCNGSPSDELDATGSVRRVFSGLARAVVRVGQTPGRIRIVATSSGINSDSVVVESHLSAHPSLP
jgi:hypothetical protein